MEKHITDVAFDMHLDSITAAWLLPSATLPRLVRQLSPARWR